MSKTTKKPGWYTRMILSGRRCLTTPTAVTKHVLKHFMPFPYGTRVLDYGAGARAVQSKILEWHVERAKLLDIVIKPYDLPENAAIRDGNGWGPMDLLAKDEQYWLVMASNVLNVQPDLKHVESVIRELRLHTYRYGVMVCNMPCAPRYHERPNSDVMTLLQHYFGDIRPFKGGIVLECRPLAL